MATEQNKKLIEKLFTDAMNGRKLNVIDEVIAPGFTNHGIPNAKTGPAGFKEIIQQFIDAFPDMKIKVETIIAENDYVATNGYWTGTNKGSFMGMPASNKQVKVAYVDFWKIQNGKAVENWVQMDMAGMMVQTGAMPAPEHA
jgi:steroid delta-isomerase-like uncharacterized protein